MPELPEVETIKNAIEKGIGKAKIVDLIVRNPQLRIAVPEDIDQKVCGATILRYTRIAKYIVMELDNGYSLLWHMGMSGKVKISDSVEKEPNKHDHVILTTSNGVVTYNDPRRFGLFTYCQSKNLSENRFIKSLGIDPFDERLDEIICLKNCNKGKRHQ